LAKSYVVSLGGAGNNALNAFIKQKSIDATTITIDTDLNITTWASEADIKLFIGENTNGCGTMASPEKGKNAVLMHEDDYTQLINGADIVVIVCFLGGGTGTGGLPETVKISKKSGAKTFVVSAMPLSFVHHSHRDNSEKVLPKVRNFADGVFLIDQELFVEKYREDGMNTVFKKVNEAFSDVIDCILENQEKGIECKQICSEVHDKCAIFLEKIFVKQERNGRKRQRKRSNKFE
jgi:cell division protein FtsZ